MTSSISRFQAAFFISQTRGVVPSTGASESTGSRKSWRRRHLALKFCLRRFCMAHKRCRVLPRSQRACGQMPVMPGGQLAYAKRFYERGATSAPNET
eukprot:2630044-Pleurochrysis_carterae.AAC.2